MTIADSMSDDFYIYYLISLVSHSAASTSGRKRINQMQRVDLSRRIRGLADSKFPFSDGISHDGFRIASYGLAYLLSPSNLESEENALLEQAKLIPNQTDRIHVLALLATTIFRNRPQRLSKLVSAQREAALLLRVAKERSDLLTTIAEYTAPYDRAEARRCLEAARAVVVSSNSGDLKDISRRIIDVAYQFDPEFAPSLSVLSDGDAARARNIMEMQRRLRRRKSESDVSSLRGGKSKDLDEADTIEICQTAWDALGKLNANLLDPVPLDSLMSLLGKVGTLPLSASYPAYSWAIENVVRRIDKSTKSDTLTRELFNALTEMSHVALSFSSGSVLTGEQFRSRHEQSGKSRVFGEGRRQDAIDFVSAKLSVMLADQLIISEPYFEFPDLELLRIVQSINPDCHIRIATGLKILGKSSSSSFKDDLLHYWRHNVSLQDPPATDFYFLGGDGSGTSPLHDRWWISGEFGFRIGTSFNSIGIGRSSEIAELSAEEAAQRKFEILRFLDRSERYFRGNRIAIQTFSIPE